MGVLRFRGREPDPRPPLTPRKHARAYSSTIYCYIPVVQLYNISIFLYGIIYRITQYDCTLLYCIMTKKHGDAVYLLCTDLFAREGRRKAYNAVITSSALNPKA